MGGRIEVLACDALAVEEDIFGFQIAGKIGFGNDAGRHVPVQGARAGAGFLYAIAIGVIGVGEDPLRRGGSGDSVLRVVAVAGKLIIGEGGSTEEFASACAGNFGLVGEITPGIVRSRCCPSIRHCH